MDRVQSSLFWW